MDEKKSYQLLQFAEDHDGYVEVAEARRFGLSQTYLVQAEEEGQFIKAAKGLYIKKGYPLDPYYIVHFRYPKAIFHLRSACYLHHYLDEDDALLSVKLPRNYMTKGLEGCRCVHLRESDYASGMGLTITSNGQFVIATDKERTLVDVILHQDIFSPLEIKTIVNRAFHSDMDKERLFAYARESGSQLTIALLDKIMA